MDVLFTFTILSTLWKISDSSFTEKLIENQEKNIHPDEEISSLTGNDVTALMQELTKMLQEIQDRDRETREMVEELVGKNILREKRSGEKPCRADACEASTTIASTTTSYHTKGQTGSSAATKDESNVTSENLTTFASTTSIPTTGIPTTAELSTSERVQSLHETTTPTTLSTYEGTTLSEDTTPSMETTWDTPTQSATSAFMDHTSTDAMRTTTSTDSSTARGTTASEEPSTNAVDTTQIDILAPTPPPEREIGIPFATNNGECFNEQCPQKPFVYVPGRIGKPGAPGERGHRGVRGPKGEQGDPGVPGVAGQSGRNGPKGNTGDPGLPGMKGDCGVDGPRGIHGLKGGQGEKGEMGGETAAASRALYTRWGARDCSTTAVLLYEGYAVGAAYNQKGGGTSYLCLPRNPQFNQYRNGVDTWRAYLYGSEYEENNFPPLAGKDDGDVPCAVCIVTERSAVLMQPARTDCPEGWTREYFGYLMASSHIYYRSEWTCVDGNATLLSSQSLINSDGALFYPTEVCCGNAQTGLPCNIYPNGYELTCSVCSR